MKHVVNLQLINSKGHTGTLYIGPFDQLENHDLYEEAKNNGEASAELTLEEGLKVMDLNFYSDREPEEIAKWKKLKEEFVQAVDPKGTFWFWNWNTEWDSNLIYVK